MKKRTVLFVLLFSVLPLIAFSQSVIYQGPAAGSIPNGVSVTTNSFSRVVTIEEPRDKRTYNKVPYIEEPFFVEYPFPTPQEGSNYFEDTGTLLSRGSNGEPVLLKNFAGIPETNSIPPDPHIAVGPDHIIAVVNTRFAIWDKQGNLLKNIAADSWFQSVLSNPGAFDPKILYDHFAQRWIMVWLSVNDGQSKSYYLLSISDDSDPLGTWFNWALPSNQNGNTVVGNWADYEGVGFDSLGIYFTSNQFTFGSNPSFQYVKLRVIPKAQLLLNNAGPVNWQDIWDIRRPGFTTSVFTIRPTITYGNPDGFYLVYANSSSGNTFSVYKLSNVLTTPSLTGFNVNVAAYTGPPLANQLGGSSLLIENGGAALKNEPTYRDGYIWAVHSVRNTVNTSYSSVRYVKIDLSTNTAVEDVALGLNGFWHFYPALAVDKDQNIAITYSRSGTTEYIGAYYTSRLKNDPPGLNPSMTLQTGKGNYVKDYGSGRNRWGDYMGIWLDPETEYNFWMFTEYAAGTNTWGTWTGELRLVPFSGPYLFSQKNLHDFGNVEVAQTSDTASFIISNYGDAQVTITSLPSSSGPFQLLNAPSLPYNLNSYDSLTLKFVFLPQDTGFVEIAYPLQTNDPNFAGINLKGRGYVINPAYALYMYASSGNQNSAKLMNIDLQTGLGYEIGYSPFDDVTDVKSIAIHPETNIIYGLSVSGSVSNILKVNAQLGDAYILHTLPLVDMVSVSFDTSGTLYGILRNGQIYTVDIQTGVTSLVTTAPIQINSATFNPFTNELWACLFKAIGTGKDLIFKINLATGDTNLVGSTGTGFLTNGLEFDGAGNLYGLYGSANQVTNFFSIDTSNAAGTLIAATGFKNLTDLAYTTSGTVGVDKNDLVKLPSDYELEQNYPNPFNPSTKIQYSLPVDANIRLSIYNILGETVKVLVNTSQKAGKHSVLWNGDDYNGNKVSSGIYFYELRADGINGSKYSQLKKMILIK
ncbi:MAG: T9SS type A sorting domain-containing protein [Ignavibacteriaceae bacterium]|nr:T9SS type A sorting domain-containing protein [Ignavibacteriaceae bacterium]